MQSRAELKAEVDARQRERRQTQSWSGAALDVLMEKQTRIAELEAVVEKLPKDAEGNPATPGVYYTVHPKGRTAELGLEWLDIILGWWHHGHELDDARHYTIGMAYRTPEAAEAAKQAR